MKSLSRIASILVPVTAFLSATVAHASVTVGVSFGDSAGTCSGAICNVANTILYLINYVAVPVLFAIAFIVFLYGIFKAYILSGGDPDKVKEGHQLVLWGVIGFAVMISLWGLVNVVASTFGLAGYAAPPLPKSY